MVVLCERDSWQPSKSRSATLLTLQLHCSRRGLAQQLLEHHRRDLHNDQAHAKANTLIAADLTVPGEFPGLDVTGHNGRPLLLNRLY